MVYQVRKELESPDLVPNELLWDELEHRPPHPTSVPDLTNVLEAKWDQIHTVTLQNLIKNLPRNTETAADVVYGFGVGCSKSVHDCDGEVSGYFRPFRSFNTVVCKYFSRPN